MEATRPKKKRKTKSRPHSNVIKETSSSASEIPVSSEVPAATALQEEVSVATSKEQKHSQESKEKLEDIAQHQDGAAKKEDLPQSASVAVDNLKSVPVSNVTDSNVKSMADSSDPPVAIKYPTKLSSENLSEEVNPSLKSTANIGQPLELKSDLPLVSENVNQTSTGDEVKMKGKAQEVKSKALVTKEETQPLPSVKPLDIMNQTTIEHTASSTVTTESTNQIAGPLAAGSHVISYQSVVPSAPSHMIDELTNQSVVPSAPSHMTDELTNQSVVPSAPSHMIDELTNQSVVPSAPSHMTDELTNQSLVPSAPSHMTDELTNQSVAPSAPALIQLTEQAQLAPCEAVRSVEVVRDVEHVSDVETHEERLLYPRLDSILQEQDGELELTPFSEEDLSLLCPNRQLDTHSVFVDNFLRHTSQEPHPLYELLTTYLKAKQALTSSIKEMEALKNNHNTHQPLVWKAETKEVNGTGKCADGSKVSHTHSYKFSMYMVEHAVKTASALRGIRELIQEELCLRSYSSQLAKIHIDNFLFKVVSSYPELSSFSGDAPVSGWVPMCPPGELNPYTAALRDCISVLFMFERKPVMDKEFSDDCRHWLDLLLSALLRIASLSDHRFILNHLLRCPPGVAKWGAKYICLPSPLHTRHTLHTQFPDLSAAQNDFILEWGVESGLYGNWGGPLIDHFVTSLANLLLPIEEREEMLSLFEGKSQLAKSAEVGADREAAQTWTFVEDSDEEDVDIDSMLLLKETDFISIFEQFPFSELFHHILTGATGGGNYSVEHVSSHSMLRLFAFGSRLIRLLGAAFSTLKLARYKEFVKKVGKTIGQTVQFTADIWILYKAHRLLCGDTPTSLPSEEKGGDPRYSLNRLQLEFDQFVLRATRWILSAHKLGAWQFLADMPYGTVSTEMVWQIFWNIYCKPCKPDDLATSGYHGNGGQESQRTQREVSPTSVADIQEAVKDERYKDQFVDHLMKTYTSQAVFLLTTLVNVARARPSQEAELIDTIAIEIFGCTQVVDYAKDAYSRTGHTLLDSIAIVHPFIISTLLKKVESSIKQVGENCILLFKELPLHLWIPTSHDLHVISSWLINSPLTSSENVLARNILNGLNWGTKSEEGFNELVLPWSTHCSIALTIVEATVAATNPGGKDNTSQYSAYLQRFTTSTEQTAFTKWSWEVIMMLKLHPQQLPKPSMQTLNPFTSSTQPVSPTCTDPPWVRRVHTSEEPTLPDLLTSNNQELSELQDSVKNEGLLASYVALCVTTTGTDTTHFTDRGIPMLQRLISNGFYLPVLRVLANVTPRFFKHKDALLKEERFIQIIVSICSADQANASLKEKWTSATPQHFVTKKMAALIQTQLQEACAPSGVGGDAVLQFWLHILLACPFWYRDSSILHVLDTLCMATHSNQDWQRTIQRVLLEAYKELNPIQQNQSIISSVKSSLTSMIRQTGTGAPSLHNAVSCSECPWLAFHTLCAEQTFEEEQGIWNGLLKQLKKDSKCSIDTALKRAFNELNLPGGFPSTHLCVYRWAEFAASLSQAHPILPLIWQRFFMLYLRRPLLDSSMPERNSQGIRLFSISRAVSLRKRMKASLSSVCKELKDSISKLERGENLEGRGIPQEEQRQLLSNYLPKALKLFQTYRLWLEEPRLHTAELYLRALPPQYEADKLAAVFKHDPAPPWMDYVPLWEVKGQLSSLVDEWTDIVTYQKNLGSKVQTPDSSPDFAMTRLKSRLQSTTTPTQPPPFAYINPPVAIVTKDVLTTRDALMTVIKSDLQCITDQARSYCRKLDTMTTLDEHYMDDLPKLFSNEPRQFHKEVPCQSRFNRSKVCQGPATIVFRIDEMTMQPRVDQDLKVNRMEYNDILNALSKPVLPELCRLVMKLENTVLELSRMATQSTDLYQNIPLQNGVALFYEILKFVDVNTRHYPPSRQVLTACLQILGQEFIQRDSLQTSNILNQLLSQQGNSDILVPLFQPNLAPDQFIHMYGTAEELSSMEGPSVAFAVLTKFNIRSWLTGSTPNLGDRSQLLQLVSQGLCLSGPTPTGESSLLVELYRRHFMQLTEFKFPDQYSDALRMAINCTDNGSITIDVWNDLCTLIGSNDNLSGCQLNLTLIKDSIKLLSSNYLQKRMISGQTLYSLLATEYVPVIGRFIRGLALGLVERWVEAVTMETADHIAAAAECWASLAELFQPWIASIASGSKDNSKIYYPCLDKECESMALLLTVFVEVVITANSSLKDHPSTESMMSHVWNYYYDILCQPHTPSHITHTYHTALVKLPWSTFTPNLTALDSMTKLRLREDLPRSCFVFLGQVFPLIEWKRIAVNYHDSHHHDNGSSVNFHIMILQLLIMLAADDQIMKAKDTGIPEAIADAHSFHWETVDAKTYQDVVNWQKTHCEPTAVLNTGSSLFLSLRLLKCAAGFPTSTGPPEYWHNDTWDKRMAYIHLVVDLIGRSTLSADCLSLNFSDSLSHLYQTALDICVHEYTDYTTSHIVPLMQAIVNIFSCCRSDDNVQDLILRVTFDIIEQLPNSHLLTLPTITASCRAIHSVCYMVRLIEHCMERHFTAVPAPQTNAEELPKDPLCMYGWKSVIDSLIVSEEILEEFCSSGITEFAGLTLHGHLLQMLPQCTSMAQESRICSKLVGWCNRVKALSGHVNEAKMFLLWEKALGLLLRQIRFGGNYSEMAPPHFTTLATSMTRYGEDKASEGLLGAIGLGKKSIYSFEFRLISRAMAVFIHCQMPVDQSQSTQLRVTPNAPGHIGNHLKPQSSTPTLLTSKTPTKQALQALNSVEGLISNKNYLHLKEHVIYILEFVKNPTHCLMDCNKLLVYLCTALYSDCRFLDLLKVLEV